MLSEDGRIEAERIAHRHDVPLEAVTTLLSAMRRGGGRQAQFSHSALGGMGQWSRGGGIMIGDMFNHHLKAKLERLCNELAESVDDERFFVSASAASFEEGWWPLEFGRPSSTGRQNDQAYAFFAEAHRLAIHAADGVRIYDTGVHRITGVSQGQGSAGDLAFNSELGVVTLEEFRPLSMTVHVGEEAAARPSAPAHRGEGRMSSQRSANEGGAHDVLSTLERLHELHRKGILTETEFVEKKRELLARL